MTDYLKILNLVIPTIKYSYPREEGTIYKVDYESVVHYTDDSGKDVIKGIVKFERISGYNKITIANKVLLECLYSEIWDKAKYIGLSGCAIRIIGDYDKCI